ncbi:MAG: sel1 repeat family protein, partial [Rhodobacteraceae bacterium]|nr:sel1 repeat family protein [Paracoccaceae bacterium]
LEKNPDTITSRIVDSDGSAMVLKLASDKFSTNYLESTGLTLMTFSISDSDIELIQSANNWILEVAGIQHHFSLAGSRDALDYAMALLAEDQKSSPAQRAAEAMAACDAQAGHPWDVRGESDGTAWSDMSGTAVDACEEAQALGNHSARLTFQLARAYDKAGDPRTFELMKEAAWEEDYGAAYNHLGIFYRDGEHTEVNLERAERAFRRGAAKNNEPSRYGLAILLRDAANTAEERAIAHKFLETAADAGYPSALEEYGKMVLDGEVDGRSQSMAQKYLELASDVGENGASYQLAVMFRDGIGVAASPRSYLHYLRIAAKQGNAAAKKELGEE